MSRIGIAPVTKPKDVAVTIGDTSVLVKGPRGELTLDLPRGVNVSEEGAQLHVGIHDVWKKSPALHGLVRAQLANHIVGVTTGWTRSLELAGVGYRAAMSGTGVVLTVGFSHPVTITPPVGITLSVTEGKIIVTGADKQLVGQVAANIRKVKKPEPYKGKGIRFVGEYIRKKAGKAAKAVGAGASAAK